MLIGLFMMLNALVRFPMQWLLTSVVIVALVPVIYSYVIYRQIEGFAPDGDNIPKADDTKES